MQYWYVFVSTVQGPGRGTIAKGSDALPTSLLAVSTDLVGRLYWVREQKPRPPAMSSILADCS
jgi:hypothetical protein